MGGGGSSAFQRAQTPEVYSPESPNRTIAETPESLDTALFSEGVVRSDNEIAKKTQQATSRLIIPLDNSTSATTGGTTAPSAPTRVV